jgi:hypothetical protein
LLIYDVRSIPDDYSGELPMAFIVLSEEASQRVKTNSHEEGKIKAAIAKYVAGAKVAYKHLVGGVQIVNAIPKNPRWVCLFSFAIRNTNPDSPQWQASPAGSPRPG